MEIVVGICHDADHFLLLSGNFFFYSKEIKEEKSKIFGYERRSFSSGWVFRKHAGFAHTKRGLSLSRKGTVPFLYTMPAQPSNGFLNTQPELFSFMKLEMLYLFELMIYLCEIWLRDG
jgi:hypothetical protein